jgi:asparagine synthase (glutamine-hydrolysing)
MCGIAGILNINEAPPPSEQTLRRMLGAIRHRGPDQFGMFLGDRVALGNARLSIIDVGGGQQPISNDDQTLWIVYNGEVFNYLELRRELEAKGHRFRTHTDTEVLLRLYEEEGPECLVRLNGQFAFAIWDERNRSLFMARDRVGVRPLFYTRIAGTLIFASEVKALMADPRVPRELDPIALDQIFTYWSTLAPRTCFRDIETLPPGHCLLAARGEIQVRAYWQLDFAPAEDVERRSQESYREELKALLTDATRIRLRADVPVGAYLSGGLDSSLIAGLIRSLGVSRLDTFSIAFNDAQFDESEHQSRMARFLGTDHQVVRATHADIGRIFPEVIWHTESPVMRTAPAPMYMLSKLVHDQAYKVVLTGEGADEFLGGYDIFKETMVRRFWARAPQSRWRPRLLDRLYPDISALQSSGGAFLRAFFGSGLGDVDARAYSHAIRWRNNHRTTRFFSKQTAATAHAAAGHGIDSGLRYPARFDTWGPLEKAQYLEISIFLSQYLLCSQGDRPAMAHSVEGRFPFLDARVVEFCCRLPSHLKLAGLSEKHLLKQVGREMLPRDVWSRPKRPYRAPIHRSFFNDATCDYVRELLSPVALAAAGWFKPEAVSHLVAKCERGLPVGETDDMALAGILSTQLVHHQFIAAFRPAAPIDARDDVKICGSRRYPTPCAPATAPTEAGA